MHTKSYFILHLTSRMMSSLLPLPTLFDDSHMYAPAWLWLIFCRTRLKLVKIIPLSGEWFNWTPWNWKNDYRWNIEFISLTEMPSIQHNSEFRAVDATYTIIFQPNVQKFIPLMIQYWTDSLDLETLRAGWYDSIFTCYLHCDTSRLCLVED